MKKPGKEVHAITEHVEPFLSKANEAGSNPTLRVTPAVVRDGELLSARGSGWPDCPITIEIDGKMAVIHAMPLGSRVDDGLRPDGHGHFVVVVWTRGLQPGRHTLTARSDHAGLKEQSAEIVVTKRHVTDELEGEERREAEGKGKWETAKAEKEKSSGGGAGRGTRAKDAEWCVKDRDANGGDTDREPGDAAYQRWTFLFDQSFDHLGYIPPGIPLQQIADVRLVRDRRQSPLQPAGTVAHSIIIEGACNWTPVASAPALAAPFVGNAGRVNAIVVDPTARDTVYLGASGGGVWKTTDGGANWRPMSDYKGSLRISSLAIDPHNHLRVFAGTGDGGYPGIGLLHSDDGGATWSEEAAGTLGGATVLRIVFDAADTTSRHMFAATTLGVYETVNGTVWTRLRAGMADGVVLVPGAGGAITLVAAFRTEGLFRATKSGGNWSAWTQSTDADLPSIYGRITLGQCAGTPTTILAVVAQSSHAGIAGVFRSTTGGSSWSRVDVRLDTRYAASDITGIRHSHTLTIPTADMIAAPASHTYTTGSAGAPSHTHTTALTTAQVRAIATGAQTEVATNVDSSDHTHTYLIYGVSQAHYNLYVAVHPTTPTTIYLGATFVWKSSTGGGVFSNISETMHVDQHSFAFDPIEPTDRVWAGNDGGIFRSTDRGTTWVSRNNGLSTLEYYSVAVHPQWENVLIAGSQDNGVQRYSGSPVALEVHGWDIMVTAIDPTAPSHMYIARQLQNGIMRSDAAGQPGSWSDTAPIPSGSAQWGNPFVLDPSDSNVCFFGNTHLWRSPMRGDSWVDVTGELPANVHKIAVHPTDSNTVYFATMQQAYRARRTGATWSGNDVSVIALGAPTASGGINLAISALAVESSGAVWATSATVGSFPHAFRLEGGAWVARSIGLPPSVEINTMVIDRTTPETRFFLGGAIGVYRSDDGGSTWAPWDAGIPNASVSQLVIGPGRMIRASTFGRGVWERKTDPALPCPRVDLYMRDTIVDSGRRTPSPDGVAHPFDPARLVWHWQSPDIKVDAVEGTPEVFQTTALIEDAVGFASIRHRNPRRNRTNRFYAQVHNRGYAVAHHVQVRAFFVDANVGLALPSDFWTMGHPFSGTPSGMGWTPLGPAQLFDEIFPGRPAIASWEWFVQPEASEHSCLLVVVTSDDDVLAGTPFNDVDSLVVNRRLAAQKNLHVVTIPGEMPMDPDDASLIELGTTTQQSAATVAGETLTSISVHWGNLPKDARIVMAFEEPAEGKYPVLASRKVLGGAGIKVVKGKKEWLSRTRTSRCGRKRRFDVDRVLLLRHIQPRTTIPDIVLPPTTRGLQFRLLLDGPPPKDDLYFDVVRHDGARVIGGNTYVVRGKRRGAE